MSDKSISKSFSNLSTTDTICCCSIQGCQKCIQMEQENALLKSELEQLRKETEKLARFVLIPNKINDVTQTKTCCESKCINKDLKYGSCISKNGYVNVLANGKIKYYLADKKENNKLIAVYAQDSFKRAYCYSYRYSLFYFEVKMIKEAVNESYVSIGFNNIVAKIEIYNGTKSQDFQLFGTKSQDFQLFGTSKSQDFQLFSWNDGDIFGCGLVFQPNEKSHAIVFFTKNGNKIGNKIFLEEIEELYPTVEIQARSVETNFGYDLETKPFMYDVNKHFI